VGRRDGSGAVHAVSYLRYAEFRRRRRRDIWSSPADVFASIANYLKGEGWKAGRSWGREVALERSRKPGRERRQRRNGSCQATRDMTVPLTMTRWSESGVRLPGGGALPKGDDTAALVSGSTRHFLVTANYDALLNYNCSHSRRHRRPTRRSAGRTHGARDHGPGQQPRTKGRPSAKRRPSALDGRRNKDQDQN
jgi:hypothetical protein